MSTRRERAKKQGSNPAFQKPMTPEESVLPTNIPNEPIKEAEAQPDSDPFSFSNFKPSFSSENSLKERIVSEKVPNFDVETPGDVTDFDVEWYGEPVEEKPAVSPGLLNIYCAQLDDATVRQNELMRSRARLSTAYSQTTDDALKDSLRRQYNEYGEEISKLGDKIRNTKVIIKNLRDPNTASKPSTRGIYSQLMESARTYSGSVKYKAKSSAQEESIYVPRFVDDMDVTKNYKYRCILGNNGITRYFIKHTDTVTLTDEQLIDAALSGSNNNVRLVDGLPNTKKVSPKAAKKAKPLLNFGRRRAGEGEFISVLDFATNTNNLFSGEISANDFVSIYRKRVSFSRYLSDMEINTVDKNLVIRDLGSPIIGLTTGVIDPDLGVQIIAIDIVAGSYVGKSTYTMTHIPRNNVRLLADNRECFRFFRFKVKSADLSNQFLSPGRKKLRTSMVGRILPGDFLTGIATDFTTRSDDQPYTLVSFIEPESGNTVKFFMEELEIIPVAVDKLNKKGPKADKTIKEGRQCVIVDDRRLKNMSKGDVVTVVSIKKNKANMKNSIVTVKIAGQRQNEVVQLKQLKVYVTNNK